MTRSPRAIRKYDMNVESPRQRWREMDTLDLKKPRRRWRRPASFEWQILIRPTATRLQQGTGNPDWIRLRVSLSEGNFRVLYLAEKAFRIFYYRREKFDSAVEGVLKDVC